MSEGVLNGQLLTATEEQLRSLITLVDMIDDEHVIDWLCEWAAGRKHYITDSPYAPLSTEGAASADRVISFLGSYLREER